MFTETMVINPKQGRNQLLKRGRGEGSFIVIREHYMIRTLL